MSNEKKIIKEVEDGIVSKNIRTLTSEVCMLVWTQIEGKVERTHLYDLRRNIQDELKNNEIYHQKKDK